MTTINQINDSGLPLTAQTGKPQKNDTADAFENVFNKALDKTQAKQMIPTSVNALSEIASSGLKIIDSSGIVSGKTGKLLDMLDAYSIQLQDPEVSLKNIEPVLEKIRINAGTLFEETQRLSAADENLKKIATQTIVTAQTEYLKFQRGDYLS